MAAQQPSAATFYCRLPCEGRLEFTLEAACMPGPPTVHILLVESDQAAALLLTEAMSHRVADFEISHVSTLEAALASLRDRPCEVALVELNLPDSQGLSTLVRLHQ